MAYLEFKGNRFLLSSSVNIIGKEKVGDFNTLTFQDDFIQSKHAVIVEECGQYQIMDICSGSTRLKFGDGLPFEQLEPMKFYKLSDCDLVELGGSIVIKFHVSLTDVVESSQATQFLSLSSTAFKNSILVHETEAQNSFVDILETEIEIPATQNEIESRSTVINSGFSDALLDLKSDRDETSNDSNMFSQNVFGDQSLRNKSSTSPPVWLCDDGLEEFEGFLGSKKTESVAALPACIEEARDGSVTPDFLESNGDIICPLVIKEEPMLEKTQIINNGSSSDDDDESDNKMIPDFLALQTQPMISADFRTRNQIKKQAEIKPKTVSLADFDATQAFFLPSKKSNNFAMETEPILPFISTKSETKTNIMNRIFLSSDDSDDEQSHSSSATENETKPINIQEEVKTKKPENKVQLEENSTTPKKSFLLNSSTPATPRYTDSPLFIDTEPLDIFPKLPSDSQLGKILDLINESQPLSDSVVTFDTIEVGNEENFNQHQIQEPKRKPPKRIYRKIMKYDSDSDDEVGPSNKKKVKLVPKKILSLPAPQKVYAIALSNINGPQKKKYSNLITKLGCRIVDKISDADILLSSKTLKFTMKFITAICKGIPIVSVDFIDASIKNQQCENPENFIIVDDETEQEKQFSLANVLKQAKAQKMFAGHSVLVTKNSTFPFEEISELVEIAGGECVKTPKNFNDKKLVVIYNSADITECKSMVKKYPNIRRLKDVYLVKAVLHQKI